MFIRVVFLKIGEIDTLKEKYAADVFIQARWHDSDLDGRTDLVGSTLLEINVNEYKVLSGVSMNKIAFTIVSVWMIGQPTLHLYPVMIPVKNEKIKRRFLNR